MLVTELDTFVHKFHQLWNAGYNAHLDLDTRAGVAWVGLRVQLGHVPGPLHHQVNPPFSKNLKKKTESPSRQRRCARRAAERQRQAAAEKAPVTDVVKASSLVKDVIDKQTSENVDAIDETNDKDKISKETLGNEEVVKFDEFVDNETEQVELRNTENVDLQVQTDNDSFVNSYGDHKEALEKVKKLEDNINNTFDNSTTAEETTNLYTFWTSTPKSESDRCEECLDNTECVDCIVKHVLRKHESLRKILF